MDIKVRRGKKQDNLQKGGNMDLMKDGHKNRNGSEMKTRLIMDVVEMETDEEPIEDEEEEAEICTLVALNLDTGVEVSLHKTSSQSSKLR